MKKPITLVMLWGITLTAFTQIGSPQDSVPVTPGKWDAVAVKNIKKGMGRLNLNFPPGQEWSVDIYKGSKFIINRSIKTYKLKYHDLPPGTYSFKVNTVLIENVPIESGKITTLKTGVLDIQSNDWELRSEDNKKYLTSGNKARVLVLPIGKYILINGKTPERIYITEALNAAIDPSVLETTQWVARPMNNVKSVGTKRASGRLNFDFGDSLTKSISGLYIGNPSLGYHKSIPANGSETFLDLPPGLYKIKWQGTSDTYENVKIIEGYETRLKYVVFGIQAESKWVMGVGPPSHSGCGPQRFALPVGIGVALWPIGSYVGGFVQTFNLPAAGVTEQAKVGYLKVNREFKIEDGNCVGYSPARTVIMIPGKYEVIINGVTRQVTINEGETVVLE